MLHLRASSASLSPPVLQTVSNSVGNEYALQTFTVTATDADGTVPVLSAADLPDGASFSDNYNGTGTFSWIPGNTAFGTHSVTFVATDALDSGQTDEQSILIEVLNAHVAPVIALPPGPSIGEGTELNIVISATDVDGHIPALSVDTGVARRRHAYRDNNDGTGGFSWTPQARMPATCLTQLPLPLRILSTHS